jgi:hypothetical protein
VTYQGFSQALQTQGDMLVKLRHDLDRLKADPVDAFAAYDFFVTAFHMSEWPPKASIDPTLLALLKHLAVGAKHFKPTDPRLQSVADVKTLIGFDPAGFGAGFAAGRLMIDLGGEAARKFGKEVSVLALAEQALRAWEAAVSKPAVRRHRAR